MTTNSEYDLSDVIETAQNHEKLGMSYTPTLSSDPESTYMPTVYWKTHHWPNNLVKIVNKPLKRLLEDLKEPAREYAPRSAAEEDAVTDEDLVALEEACGQIIRDYLEDPEWVFDDVETLTTVVRDIELTHPEATYEDKWGGEKAGSRIVEIDIERAVSRATTK